MKSMCLKQFKSCLMAQIVRLHPHPVFTVIKLLNDSGISSHGASVAQIVRWVVSKDTQNMPTHRPADGKYDPNPSFTPRLSSSHC
jgi:hypothetical protein